MADEPAPAALSGPVYGSWDEAMSDPELDLSRPWFVAPDPVEPAAVVDQDWPDGWVEIGATTG